MQADRTSKRLGVFAELAGKSRRQFGRTALMKLCYFLQEVKHVPLGYKFSLYSYGPFDSDVLADLQTAEELKILESRLDRYPGGYGYLISRGSAAQDVLKKTKEFVDKYSNEIDWAATTLASKSASELELISTIVFVSKDRKAAPKNDLVPLVRAVKPHFSPEEVARQIEWLATNDLLELPQRVRPQAAQ